MRDGWKQEPAVTGGCQCGAVRYAIAAGPAKSTVCHCRMCQRATGNAFAPLFEVMTTAIRWTGTPATWPSSDQVERGFCGTCGTPLFYRGHSRDTTEIMSGTLTPRFDYRPIANHGTESRVGWLATLSGLPDRATFFSAGEVISSRQAPEDH
ncbi:MAG: GFA family protein [Paracoccaceae bacterium]